MVNHSEQQIEPTENASGFTFPERPQMNARFLAYFEQITELYENQESYTKILAEFNKRQEEAEEEIRNANQTNESTNTELVICDTEEERNVSQQSVIPDPADDIQPVSTCEILYSA
jgi:hypothetical protein